MKNLIVSFIVLYNLGCSNKPRTETTINKEHKLVVNNCGIMYNDEPLKLGTPIEEWERILGSSRKTESFYVWDDVGVTVQIDYVRNTMFGVRGDDTVYIAYVFFQNLDDPGAKKFRVYTDEEIRNSIYPKKVYQGALELDGALIARGMGMGEIKERLEEADENNELKFLQRIEHGMDPFSWYGFNGKYTSPSGDFCNAKRYVRILYNSPFKEVTDDPISNPQRGWQPAIEFISIEEISTNGYYTQGEHMLLKSIESKDEKLKKQAIEILQRAVQKGSEEAKLLLEQHGVN